MSWSSEFLLCCFKFDGFRSSVPLFYFDIVLSKSFDLFNPRAKHNRHLLIHIEDLFFGKQL
jgi:hypothetical protein